MSGTTEFLEPIALAATFDSPGIHEMAKVISIEARVTGDPLTVDADVKNVS